MNPVRRARATLLLAALPLALGPGCTTMSNYLDPEGPSFVAHLAPPPAPRAPIRVVTFNVEYGERIEAALHGLRSHPALRDADLLLLQEMDAPGVEAIARALGMNYVYYPASHDPKSGRDMGNAILSPWSVEEPRKILLPHLARGTRRARIAVTARVSIDGRPIQVYSVHLGSPLGTSGGNRGAQAEVVLLDADARVGPVIVAGDFNSHGVGERFLKRGYSWPTRHVGHSVGPFSFDHVFVRGLPPTASAGVAREVNDASDHRPVWTTLSLDEAGQER